MVRRGLPGSASEAYGADSVEPRQIPLSGWLVIMRRVARRVVDDKLSLYSAGVAFFAVLSIAPVLLTALSVYGTINTPAEAIEHLSGVASLMPPALGDLVTDQLVSITTASTQLLTVRGLLALAVALGTAITATTFLIDALTVAYREKETRGVVHRTLLALGFVLGGAVALGALITVSTLVSRFLSDAPAWVRVPFLTVVWIGFAALIASGVAVLYRYAPDRHGRARWRWIRGGATATTALWLAGSAGLFLYVQNLGTYERTYGSLAGVAISMFWLWFTILLLILGAAFNAETERQTARDSTVGTERAPGERGAVVADDIPPYPDDPS